MTSITQVQGRCFALALLVSCLLGPVVKNAEAQDYLTQQGTPSFTQSESVELGSVNLANGNLHLEIPLGSFPERGGRQFTASLVYDSRFWQVICCSVWAPITNPSPYFPSTMTQWRFVTSADHGARGGATQTNFSCGGAFGGTAEKFTNFGWKFPDGSMKTFNAITWFVDQKCQQSGTYTDTPNGSGYANDNSGYFMVVTNYNSPTVYAPDGTQVGIDPNGGGLNNPIDSNGNYDSVVSTSDPTHIDTLGRKPVVVTTSCNGNPNQLCFDVLNSQGGTSRFVVTTASVSVHTNFASGQTECSGTITVIQSIALPDATSYTFNYDSGTTLGHFGELTLITLPTGGQVGYGYSVFSDSRYPSVRNHWVTSHTSGGGTWNYSPLVTVPCSISACNGQQQVTVSRPSGDNTVYTFTTGSAFGPGLTQIQSYAGAVAPANLIATASATWNSTYTQTTSQTTTLLVPGGTSINKTKQFTYDSTYGWNAIQISEWKYYTGSLPATPDLITTMSYTSANSSYVAKRITNKLTSVTAKTGSGTQIAQTNYSYDSTPLTSVTGAANHDDTNFGLGNTVRGNLTQVQRWNGGSSYLTTTMSYDTTGQLRSTQDPALNSASFNYADAFYDDNGGNPPPAHSGNPFTNAYLTSINYPLSISESFGYYYATGQKESHTDLNHNTTYFHYVDFFSRPTGTTFPDSGSVATTYTGQIQSDVYATVNASTTKHDEVLLDSLGRKSQRILVSDPSGSDTVDFAYNNSGQLLSVSNPHRSTASSTDGTTTYAYDALGRITATTEADGSQTHLYYGPSVTSNGGTGSQLCSSATYGLGYPTLSVDEAQKKRQSWTDGFARLIEVDEPDSTGALSVPTCYTYDLLGNLTGVLQNGSRQRTFVYDSLSRLTSATNPESGTITYTYDANSNVGTKTAPMPNQTGSATVVTNFTHDALNRLTQKSFNDGTTPTVKYGYDGVAPSGCTPPTLTIGNPIGRRTSMCDGSGKSAWSLDLTAGTGWKITEARTTNAVTKNTIYQNNFGGSVATVTYPTGRVFNYAYDAAARPASAIDPINSINFATAAAYAPTGALSSLTKGASLVETNYYNSRLQPCRISAKSTGTSPSSCTDSANIGNVLDFTYNFSLGSTDNGNVTSIANNRDTTRSASFTYDALNRLSTAKTSSTSGTTCWDDQFGYDPWANLLTIGRISGYTCSNEELLNVAATAKNQIGGYTYDAAGNLINDGLGHTYTFNAENQLICAANTAYLYDGDGKRVKKATGCTTPVVSKLYWYGTGSDALAETNASGTASAIYIFFGGRRITRVDVPSQVVHYYFSDHLGSANVVTSSTGGIQDESDYYPFGGERVITNSDPNNFKFTGKERDSESGLDNFGARYDSSGIGRFVSPDPLGGFISDPQSLNRYSYVRNNPTNLTDPSGLQTQGGTHYPAMGCTESNVNNRCMRYGSNSRSDMHCLLDGADTSCETVYNLLQKGNAGICPSSNCTNFRYDQDGWKKWVWRGEIKMTRDCYGSFDNCETSSVKQSWVLSLEKYGSASYDDPILALAFGRLPPEANPALQAAKQAAKGIPRTTPSRTFPVNTPAPGIGGEVPWEEMSTGQRITWILAKVSDGIDNATSDFIIIINPNTCNNGRTMMGGPCLD